MYADDTSICHQSRHITQLNKAINDDLTLIEKRLKGNKLSLDVMNTHAMLISMKSKNKVMRDKSESLKLKIRDSELEAVQKTEYLDVQTDNSLD